MKAPDVIYSIPGEIGPLEREAYYSLARERYTGRGEIVEIGALLGASSVCLAQGLIDNLNVTDMAGRIHVYDKFEVYQHMADLILPFHGYAPRPVGATFLDLYLTNVAPYGPLLNVHQGDAHEATWCGKPIEVLFIDCALSAELYQHFINVFYPYLIEGALIVDQDCFYQFAPWLPMKAELLVGQVKGMMAVDCALISKCLTAAPALSKPLPSIALPESLRLMERQAIRWPGELAALVHIQAAVAMCNAGQKERGLARLAEIGEWPLNPPARDRHASAMERMSA